MLARGSIFGPAWECSRHKNHITMNGVVTVFSKIEKLRLQISDLEKRFVEVDLHPIARDNQYKAVLQLQEKLKELKKSEDFIVKYPNAPQGPCL